MKGVRGVKEIGRVAAVNDLSGFGRCSLTVTIPILSAMGFQVCPVPTAVLSSHTGYPGPLIRDFSGDMEAYLAHWESLGLTFACGYTGFLGNSHQAEILEPFLRRLKEQDALRLVDPAMADHGKLYSSCSPELVPAMARLVSLASVATPNLTEACLLTGEDYYAVLADENRRGRVETMARKLLCGGCGAVVITGVEAGENIDNCVLSGADATPVWVSGHRVEQNFAGTGDVFASVLCGWLLRGVPLDAAVRRTTEFVCKATAATATMDVNGQDGIAFEPYLCDLIKEQ